MDKIKYFHELSKPEWEALKAEKLTWGEVARRHPQPAWCSYPGAVDAMGCWSLIGFDVTGEDYCLNCECHKKGECGVGDEKASQNKLCSVQIDRMQRLNMELDNNYREKLSSLYFKLEDVLGEMNIALEGAEDYPAEISKDDANTVRTFLKEADVLVESEFELFVKFSGK